MMDKLEEPVALAHIRWLTAAEGGRRSGPPSAPVYAATCLFPLGGEEEVRPGWPASAEMFSILIERTTAVPAVREDARVGFLAPELVAPFLHAGASVLVTEGPKIVAHATVVELFHR